MAAAALVGILSAAAKAYATELAKTVGDGIVETLFNQDAIAANLEQINAKLNALTEFIRNELPALIEKAADLSAARQASLEVIELAVTIKGAVATLVLARKSETPKRIAQLSDELAGFAELILRRGGALISYGQPYYASVGLAFASGVKAYSEAVKDTYPRAAMLRERALDWKGRLSPWVDAARPSSFTGVLNQLESQQAIAAKLIPTFETWNTHRERRVALSWLKLGENVMVNRPGNCGGSFA